MGRGRVGGTPGTTFALRRQGPLIERPRYCSLAPRPPTFARMNYTYIPDLAERIAELTKQGHPTEHVQGRALYTDDHVKLLAFPFEAGQALEEHTAPHPAMLHFLEGEADVTLGGEAVEARAGTWIHMAPDLPHSIRARTPVLMLLLILRAVP